MVESPFVWIPSIYDKQGILQWAGSMNDKYILGTKLAKFIE